MEVVGNVHPYADEPLARTSDESENDKANAGGLPPAVLHTRFLNQVPVNNWLVNFMFVV